MELRELDYELPEELIAQQGQLLYQLGRIDTEMDKLRQQFAALQQQRDILVKQVQNVTNKLNAQFGLGDEVTTGTAKAIPAAPLSSDTATTKTKTKGGK